MSQLGILHKQIDAAFNDDELRSLCMDLDVDYEGLHSQNKSGKARELILYLKRRQTLDSLLPKLKTERPKINWSAMIDSTELASKSAKQLTAAITSKQPESQQLYQAVQQLINKQDEGIRSIWKRFLNDPERRQTSISDVLEELFESDLTFAQRLHQLVQGEQPSYQKKFVVYNEGGQIGQVINADQIENVSGNFTLEGDSDKKS